MIEKGNLDGILLTGLFFFILFYNLIIQHFTFIESILLCLLSGITQDCVDLLEKYVNRVSIIRVKNH